MYRLSLSHIGKPSDIVTPNWKYDFNPLEVGVVWSRYISCMYVYLQRYLQNTVTCVHGFFSKVFVSCRSAWLLAIIYSVDLFTCCTCVLWWLYLFISIYRLIDLLLMQLFFLIYPQACSCNELFFVYISLSKMICAWAFYSIYLAALLVHMVTILNIIGVACHHLCSINSLTNLTRPVLIKFHPLILPYKAKPIKKAKQILSKR